MQRLERLLSTLADNMLELFCAKLGVREKERWSVSEVFAAKFTMSVWSINKIKFTLHALAIRDRWLFDNGIHTLN